MAKKRLLPRIGRRSDLPVIEPVETEISKENPPRFPAEIQPGEQRITLHVNGEPRQDAPLSDMVWSIPELIADLSRYYHLQPGDLIYTGTPAGVGAVQPGDRLEARVEGLEPLDVAIGPAA